MSSSWSNGSPILVIITEEVTGFSGLFFYSPTVGHGNLVASWTVAAGTDPYGNHYNAGLTTYYADERVALAIGYAALGGQSLSLLADSASATPAQLVFGTSGGGGDAPFMQAVSDGLGVIADFTLNAVAPGGWFSSPIAAINPNDATLAETWHSATGLLSANWTTTGATNPLRYRLEGIGAGVIRLDGEILTAGLGPWPANTTIFSLPLGYRPTHAHPFVTRSDIAVAAGQDTINVLSGGSVQNGQIFTAAGQRLFFDGVTFPLD